MIDPITEYILNEGYILSDKTVSVDLNKFESGEAKKLIIIGLCGSGKTTLGEHLKKKYKVQNFISDKPWPETKAALLNSKRSIIESAGFIWMAQDLKWKKIAFSNPMILIGMSAIKAGLRADRRDGTIPGVAKDKKEIYYFIRSNFKNFQGMYNKLRKEILSRKDADVQPFKIPPAVAVRGI